MYGSGVPLDCGRHRRHLHRVMRLMGAVTGPRAMSLLSHGMMEPRARQYNGAVHLLDRSASSLQSHSGLLESNGSACLE